MKNQSESTPGIRYIKPEMIDLGAAVTIQGGECSPNGSGATGDCVPGNMATNQCTGGNSPGVLPCPTGIGGGQHRTTTEVRQQSALFC